MFCTSSCGERERPRGGFGGAEVTNGVFGLGRVDVVSLEPLWLQQAVSVGAEGVHVGAKEEFCGAINIHIKYELC